MFASLGEAVSLLERQTDERGASCGITASWLITASENKIVGQRLVGDERLTMTGTDQTTKNPFVNLQHCEHPISR